jgi:hypothetical protein
MTHEQVNNYCNIGGNRLHFQYGPTWTKAIARKGKINHGRMRRAILFSTKCGDVSPHFSCFIPDLTISLHNKKVARQPNISQWRQHAHVEDSIPSCTINGMINIDRHCANEICISLVIQASINR